MNKLLLFALLLFISINSYGQAWDGGGDGTSWDDATNWDNDMVPAAGDIVIFSSGGTVTVSGTAANNPSRIQVNSNNNVTLNLDLTIDDAINSNHAVKVQGNASLTFGTGTFNIDVTTTKDGLQHNATGTAATLNISSSATVNILGARDGALITSGNILNNEGTLNISNVNQDGIDNSGTVNNNAGSITISDANSNGINNKAGTFNNSAMLTISNPTGTTTDGINSAAEFNNTGTLTVTKAGEDGIEILNGSTFTNDGTVNVTSEDAPGLDNNGIAVGTDAAMGTFINNGTVNGDGGIGTTTNSRAIYVYTMGTLTNNNNGTINLSNGNSARILYVDGTATNNKGGIIDLTDRRMRVNDGTLTNNGFMKSTFSGAAIFVSGTGSTTNNAFYDFGGAAYASGTNTDNGFDINDGPIDASGTDGIDFSATSEGMEIYSFTGPSMTRSNLASGFLDLTGFDFPDQAGPHAMTLDVPAYNALFTIQVSNLGENSALPIELVYFRASAVEEKVSIEWQTAVELNNDYMVVERSSDGRNFVPVEKVRGQGNSTLLNDYRVIDNNPFAGVNYYRLHQVDFDGTEDYSEIVQVEMKTGKSTTLVVYPSVVNSANDLNVDLTNANNKNMLFDVFDFNGQLVKTIELQGSTVASISTDYLQNGMYVLQSRDAENTLSTRFVIAR